MSNNYLELKNLVLGQDFPWFFVKDAVRGQYSQGQTNVNKFPFFSHVFLNRPGEPKAYSSPVSSVLPLAEEVFCDICTERQIPYQKIRRQ